MAHAGPGSILEKNKSTVKGQVKPERGTVRSRRERRNAQRSPQRHTTVVAAAMGVLVTLAIWMAVFALCGAPARAPTQHTHPPVFKGALIGVTPPCLEFSPLAAPQLQRHLPLSFQKTYNTYSQYWPRLHILK